MGIAARDRGLAMEGARAEVLKEMSAVPRRRIGKLTVRIVLPAALSDKDRTILERTARTCPVTASLSPDTELDLSFEYV